MPSKDVPDSNDGVPDNNGVPDSDDEDMFLPRIPLIGGPSAGRRERQIAAHVDRHREHKGRPPRQARGLSRADIVHTAITIADAEGTDAVSMRRIAREMRAGAMSLYWYVSSKEELHQLMMQKVQAESEAPVPSGDWRADLRSYARNARAALLRHPWAIDFIGSGPPSGPSDARNMERLIAALDGVGLDFVTVIYVIMSVSTYVLGAALREVQEIRWQEVAASLPADEMAELLGEFERRIRQSGRYPHMVRIMDTGFDPDSPETRDTRFEFGLDCVLEGIANRLPG